jgi:hypothetical protein
MKSLVFYLYITFLFLAFVACNNGRNNKEVSKNDSLKNNVIAITIGDTAKVGDALRNVVLINELDLLGADQRKYALDEFDLNDDGKMEYFVGFENDFFCEADGCTYFILNHDGSLNSRIVASYAPLTILSTKTNGWYDILVNSNSADHKLSFNKGSYPSHPWTLPVVKEDSVLRNNHFLKFVLEGKADYTF